MTDHATTHHHGDAHEQAHHIVSVRSYFFVFLALMFLMVLTVVAAFFDLGAVNPVIALSIAISKATFIVLIFMNVYFSTKLTKIFVGAGFFWLLIMFGLMIIDFVSREMVVNPLPWD